VQGGPAAERAGANDGDGLVQITVTVPNELAARAHARGIPIEAYVERLVEQAAQAEVPAVVQERRRRAVRNLLAFGEKYHFTLGEGVRIKDLLH